MKNEKNNNAKVVDINAYLQSYREHNKTNIFDQNFTGHKDRAAAGKAELESFIHAFKQIEKVLKAEKNRPGTYDININLDNNDWDLTWFFRITSRFNLVESGKMLLENTNLVEMLRNNYNSTYSSFPEKMLSVEQYAKVFAKRHLENINSKKVYAEFEESADKKFDELLGRERNKEVETTLSR